MAGETGDGVSSSTTREWNSWQANAQRVEQIPDSKSVGVVLPAYDPDPATLNDYLESVERELSPDEILVELDSPAPQVLDTLADSFIDFSLDDFSINVADERRGKGAAIISGFNSLDTDVLLYADADGSVLASSLADVVQPVVSEEADVSISSRRHPKSEVLTPQSIGRRVLGDGFISCARATFASNISDFQCGAKAVSRNAWETLVNYCYLTGFGWDLQFVEVAKALNYDVEEVPVSWSDKPDSTVGLFSTTVELITALFHVNCQVNELTQLRRAKNGTEIAARAQSKSAEPSEGSGTSKIYEGIPNEFD